MDKQQLFENIKRKKSFLCVGLDTDIKKIPEHLLKEEDPIFAFNKAIIDATADLCIAYKPNLAFYESMGVKGWIAFEKTVKYIKDNYPDQFIIADAKRGDIGNTSAMYARTFFEELDIDSVTVAPYMGEDSVTPFLSYEGKWVILLALTSNKGSHERIIEEFNNKEYNVLLGTQMIAKGLDFKDVTLVIVLNGDSTLNVPDYRSAEKTFELLTQVSGRAGRSIKEGIAIIQTYNPLHYSIVLSKNHDYVSFYNKEIKIRKQLNYPPFCFIVSIRLLTSDYELGLKEIGKVGDYLKNNLDDTYTVLGPSISLKINNIYKFQCIIKYKKNKYKYDDRTIRLVEENWGFALKQWDYNL